MTQIYFKQRRDLTKLSEWNNISNLSMADYGLVSKQLKSKTFFVNFNQTTFCHFGVSLVIQNFRNNVSGFPYSLNDLT